MKTFTEILTEAKKITAKDVQKAIKEKTGLDILLIRGRGYWWFWSDDEKITDELSGLETTSVGVYRIDDLTIDQWVNEFIDIWNNESGWGGSLQTPRSKNRL